MADFGALPPEINSARMYTGSGSGPMLASAAAWDALAAELGKFARRLFRGGLGAARPELDGCGVDRDGGRGRSLRRVGDDDSGASRGGGRPGAGGRGGLRNGVRRDGAPAVVMANRALLATLVATNFFGQNTPAIAATETHYAEMWAQDAAAMYAYAASASAAATLTSFGQPPQTTNPGGPNEQAAAVAQAVDAPSEIRRYADAANVSAPQQLSTLHQTPPQCFR